MMQFGLDKHKVLDSLYAGIRDKQEELNSINTYIPYCIKRDAKALPQVIFYVHGTAYIKSDLDEIMIMYALKKIAHNSPIVNMI